MFRSGSSLSSSSQSMSSVPTAVEEVWENHTYIPVRGWGAPYSSVSLFSDRGGDRCLSNEKFPDVSVVSGWEWSGDWTIDTSHSFGPTDSEGWCYGVTFERLLAAIASNSTSAEDQSSCMVRRRRWIRERVCVSEEALAEHQEQVDYLLDARARMEEALRCRKEDFEMVSRYEAEREAAFAKASERYVEDMDEAVADFKRYKFKLEAIRDMLVQQAKADREYGNKLESLSAKFFPGEEGSRGRRGSEGEPGEFLSSGSAVEEGKVTGGIEPGAEYLLRGISVANSSAAALWIDFSRTVTESMVKDVEEVISEVEAFSKWCWEMVNYRDKLRPNELRVKTALETLRSVYRMANKKGRAAMAAMDQRISGGRKEKQDQQEVEEATAAASDEESASDVWLCIRTYRQAVVDLSQGTSTLRSNRATFRDRREALQQRVRLVLVGTMQLFAHERARVMGEAAEVLLKQRSTVVDWNASNMKQAVAYSPTGDTETSGQEVKPEIAPIGASLPSGNDQILLQAMMQYTTLEKASKMLSYTAEKRPSDPEELSLCCDLVSVKVVATADGVMHVFNVDGKKSSSDTPPIRSVRLEGCKVVQQSALNGVLAHALEVHPPRVSGLLSSSRRSESFVLVPLDEDEAGAWVDVLCDPLCGASLLVPLVAGTVLTADSRHRASSISASLPSLDSSSAPVNAEDLFVTVPPEAPKPSRRGSRHQGRRNSTGRRTSAPSVSTISLIEQSSAALEEAKAMIQSSPILERDGSLSDVELRHDDSCSSVPADSNSCEPSAQKDEGEGEHSDSLKI
mmetsp:Transcript_8422/g.12541  ORF Transcript_8422/g.12541 Transcript_8422/m.12541 type:complete len:796 (+) Transcript_8422:25-2412(+)